MFKSLLLSTSVLSAALSTIAAAEVHEHMQQILDDYQATHNVSCAHSRYELSLKLSVYPARPQTTFTLDKNNHWQEISVEQRCDEGDTFHKGHCFKMTCEMTGDQLATQ